MAEIHRLKITPIVDLLHFGLPDWMGDFQNPEMPLHFANYAGAFARRYPWVRGYTPVNSSDYHSSQALRVLIGVRSGSGDGYGQQAFFFVNGRYIGTDASQPSAALRVVGQGDTEVTLAYPLYRSGDALCCPSRGHRQVHFQLDNGKLTALDPIPSVAERQGG